MDYFYRISIFIDLTQMLSQLKIFEALVVNFITIFMLIPSIKKFVRSKRAPNRVWSQSPYWVQVKSVPRQTRLCAPHNHNQSRQFVLPVCAEHLSASL